MENYKQIKTDLDDLRLLVEKSELWVYKAKSDSGKKKKKDKDSPDDDKVNMNGFLKNKSDFFVFFFIYQRERI